MCEALIVSGGSLKQRILAEFQLIVQIFVPGDQTENPLAYHAQDGMSNFSSLASVKLSEHFANARRYAEFSIQLGHQQQTAVAADVAAIEIKMNFSALRSLKYRIG